jgi:hypothetical protein
MSDTSDLLQAALLVTLSCAFYFMSKSVRRVVSSIFNRPGQHTIIVRHADHQINIAAARSGEVEQTIARIIAAKTIPAQRKPVTDAESTARRGRHRMEKRPGDG